MTTDETVNYFIPSPSEKKRELLNENKISFADFSVDGLTGIIIEGKDSVRVMKVLRARVTDTRPTKLVGIKMMTLEYDGQKIIQQSWDGNGYSEFAQVVEDVLMPIVNRSVVIHVPHNNEATPISDDHFHIFVWSTPVNRRKVETPAAMWGIKVDSRDQAFSASGQGIAISDGAYEVAELVGDCLYIHHDICHFGREPERAILRKILEAVVTFRVSPKEFMRLCKERLEQCRSREREAYVQACRGRARVGIQTLRNKISDGIQNAKRFEKSLMDEIRKVKDAEDELELLEKNSASRDSRVGVEFDRLLEVKGVVDVRMTNESVDVYTETLYCVHPRTGTMYEIGAFKISLALCNSGESSYSVLWINLTRKVNGYRDSMNAPHVISDGRACLGNMQMVIPQLVGNYEYAAAAMLAIQFIQTVNVEDSAGKFISKWPEAIK